MGFQRDLPRVVLLAALLFALSPRAALAAPAWLGPETLSNSGSESGAPDVTGFGDGQAAVVWTALSAATESGHIFASVRPRGGPCQTCVGRDGRPAGSGAPRASWSARAPCWCGPGTTTSRELASR